MAGGLDPAATFRQEAVDLLAQLEGVLLDMEATPDDRALVDTAFRALHTLKGSGAMFGFDALAAFTHHIETTFDQVRLGKLEVCRELVSLTLAAADHIVPITRVPNSRPFIRGLINVRGKVVTVTDLRTKFGMPRIADGTGSRIVVIEEVPKIGMRWRPEFIRAIGKRGDDFIIIADIDQVFASEET